MISNRFHSILNDWFKDQENLKAVYDLYFGIIYDPKMYIELQFLGLTQATEGTLQ